MRHFVALLLSLPVIFSCGDDMPLPPDHQLVSAADAGPGAPFTEVECPSDDAEAAAEDIRRVCAALLANQSWWFENREIHYEYTNVPGSSPWKVDATNFSGNTWTDSVIYVDVPDAKAGDDLLIRAWGNWGINSTSALGDIVGKLRIEVVEDPGGGGPLGVFDLDGNAVITDMSLTVPPTHVEQYAMTSHHRVVGDSTARVKIQVRSQDLTGGAGAATILLMFSARMDVTHVRRGAP